MDQPRSVTLAAVTVAVDAVASWTEAIRRDPGDAAARRARGAAHVEAGDLVRASADFAEALRLDPRAAIRHDRGLDYLRMGEPGMAIAEFTNALLIDPGFVEALVGRAEAFLAVGDRSRASIDERAVRRLADGGWADLADDPTAPPFEAELKRA